MMYHRVRALCGTPCIEAPTNQTLMNLGRRKKRQRKRKTRKNTQAHLALLAHNGDGKYFSDVLGYVRIKEGECQSEIA